MLRENVSSSVQVGIAVANHKQLAKGPTAIKLYDDDSYSALRKVSHSIPKSKNLSKTQQNND